jgi:DNA-binding transcriptional ArsR family regulator
MTEEALIHELRCLRSDLDGLNERIVRLRYQDFKDVFVEQMRLALGQEGKRSFDSSIEGMKGSSNCELKKACLAKQEEVITSVIEKVERDDVEGAIAALDSLESLVCGEGSPCLDDYCSSSAVEGIGKVKAILSAYQGLRERLGSEAAMPGQIIKRGDHAPSPEDMEAVLSPLSNSWRLRILVMLREADHNLSDISKALDMRTGHLQFHIRKLKEAGYISSDRKRRTYSITLRGQRALQGLEVLMGGLA